MDANVDLRKNVELAAAQVRVAQAAIEGGYADAAVFHLKLADLCLDEVRTALGPPDNPVIASQADLLARASARGPYA